MVKTDFWDHRFSFALDSGHHEPDLVIFRRFFRKYIFCSKSLRMVQFVKINGQNEIMEGLKLRQSAVRTRYSSQLQLSYTLKIWLVTFQFWYFQSEDFSNFWSGVSYRYSKNTDRAGFPEKNRESVIWAIFHVGVQNVTFHCIGGGDGCDGCIVDMLLLCYAYLAYLCGWY